MDFLVIGAQKAGTTWLYNRLQELNDFDLFPIKELHYFDKEDKYPSYSILKHSNLKSKILDFSWVKKVFDSTFSFLLKKDMVSIRWALKYYFSTYNDDWYLSLSKNKKGITGDFTPAYSLLNEEDVKKIHDILPKIKIVFLIRNPIERAWSSYRFSKRNKTKKDIDITDAIQFFDQKGQELRSDYLRTLETYKKFFPEEQILIGFYDAIADQPLQLLNHIVGFLGGETKNIINQCNLLEKNNVSPQRSIPVKLEKHLYDKYSDSIGSMNKRFGSYSDNWLTKQFHPTEYSPIVTY